MYLDDLAAQTRQRRDQLVERRQIPAEGVVDREVERSSRPTTAARSKIVRSTVVTGMPSTIVDVHVVERRDLVHDEPSCCARRHRGQVISTIDRDAPGRSQSSAHDRCEATARVPPAQHAASSSRVQVSGVPTMR